MNQFEMQKKRVAEQGSASAKFLIVAVLIVLIAHAGFNYIPVAYQGQDLRQEMQTAVTQGMAAAGHKNPTEVIKTRMNAVLRSNHLPQGANFQVQKVNGVVQASLRYSKTVSLLPFGMYDYEYVFDNTAVPPGYLTE